jgi:hypothetical protein
LLSSLQKELVEEAKECLDFKFKITKYGIDKNGNLGGRK